MKTRLSVVVAATLALAACDHATDATPAARTLVLPDSLGRAGMPAISPDGTRLAWHSEVGSRAAIFVGGLDGSNPIRLTNGVWDASPLWSPDGQLIAYYSDVGADIWVVPSTGGTARQLTSGPATDEPQQWLPDGSALLVTRKGVGPTHTVVVPLDGGPERPLVPSMGGDQITALSPNGSLAAFDLVRGGLATIWVQALDGSPARQLTTEGFEDAWNSRNMWSPDGTRLVYTSRRTGTRDLWTVDVTTGAQRQLTSDLQDDGDHHWSPDGRWIAFRSNRGGQWDIWIVADTGGKSWRVTNDPNDESDLGWSPDGTTLNYTSREWSQAIEVTTADNGASTELVASVPGQQTYAATLSPDGETVLFQSNRTGSSDLWSVPISGGEPAPFVAGPANEYSPGFSPDGGMVLFGSDRGGSPDLWVIPAAGGQPTQLTNWPSEEGFAEWSPDGSKIVFASNHESASGSGLDLWIVSASGGDPHRLTEKGNVLGFLPRWSPDGRVIYFVAATPTGTHDLFRVAASGGPPVGLGASPGIGEGALSPDGTQFAYSNFEHGYAYAEVIATAGGEPRRLSPASEDGAWDIDLHWSPDGRRLLFDLSDYAGLYSSDLAEFTWPEGALRQITHTPEVFESVSDLSADGRQIITLRQTIRQQLRSVRVAELLKGK